MRRDDRRSIGGQLDDEDDSDDATSRVSRNSRNSHSAPSSRASAGSHAVRQASLSARFDGTAPFTAQSFAAHHHPLDSTTGSSGNMTFSYQGSRGVTTEQVETLVDAVMDLHERALLCQGQHDGETFPRIRDNAHQVPTSQWESAGPRMNRGPRMSHHHGRHRSPTLTSRRDRRKSSFGAEESERTSADTSEANYGKPSEAMLNDMISLHVLRFAPPPHAPRPLSPGRPPEGPRMAMPVSPTPAPPAVDEHIAVKRRDVDAFLEQFEAPADGLTWVHVDHADSLQALALAIDAHPMMLKLFFDERPQTTLNHLDGETVLVTAVAVYLEAAELHSHKLCIYASSHLVITFERELLTGQRVHAAHEHELFKDKIFLEVHRALTQLHGDGTASDSGYTLGNDKDLFRANSLNQSSQSNLHSSTQSSLNVTFGSKAMIGVGGLRGSTGAGLGGFSGIIPEDAALASGDLKSGLRGDLLQDTLHDRSASGYNSDEGIHLDSSDRLSGGLLPADASGGPGGGPGGPGGARANPLPQRGPEARPHGLPHNPQSLRHASTGEQSGQTTVSGLADTFNGSDLGGNHGDNDDGGGDDDDDGVVHGAGMRSSPPPEMGGLNLRSMVDSLGGGFVMYLLLMELSVMGASTLQLYAEAICALHHQVHNEFSMQRRVSYLRTLNVLHHGIEILTDHFEQATALGLRGFDGAHDDRPVPSSSELPDDEGGDDDGGDGASSKNTDYMSTSFKPASFGSKASLCPDSYSRLAMLDDTFVRGNKCLREEHMPYFRDVEDKATACLRQLKGHEAALGEMRTALTDQASFWTHSTDTALSMVATLFLPLTFLAGVFGMNFVDQEREEASHKPGLGIAMLNDQYGAIFFWFIAASMAFLTFVWFFCRGWTQHFRVDLRHPYQAEHWETSLIRNQFRRRERARRNRYDASRAARAGAVE